jgi:hypothetical protein
VAGTAVSAPVHGITRHVAASLLHAPLFVSLKHPSANTTKSVSPTATGNLPFTGDPLALVAAIGLVLLGTGLVGRGVIRARVSRAS